MIHLFAMLLAQITGYGWEIMILERFVTRVPELDGYGLSIGWVYLVWIGIVVLLYPLCKQFGDYKRSNKEKKWLSYL